MAESTTTHDDSVSSLRPAHSQEPRQVTVLESRALTPTTRAIRVSRPGEFTFQVSQAARLILETRDGPMHRTFSIASGPGRNYLEFAVRMSEGPFKSAFGALRPGEMIGLSGPRGRFPFEADRPAILVAGGIGVTPLKSMIEYATDEGISTPLTLVYGNRNEEEIAFREELEALTEANPHLELVHTLSQPTSAWRGRTGRVDADLLGFVGASQPEAIYYLAGPPSMVAELSAILREVGVEKERIRFEPFKGYP